MRILSAFLMVLALATASSAQSSWYVDAENGSNANTGTAPGDAFQSITFALSQAGLASGDEIVLDSGIYNAPNGNDGTGNRLENFPILIPDGVSIVSGSVFSAPVIDGATFSGNLALLMQVNESLTSLTEVGGIEFKNCATGLSSPSDKSLASLLVRNCTFNTFSVAGISLFMRSGGTAESVQIEFCDFAGDTGSGTGVFFSVSDSTSLTTGSIADNSFDTLARGIEIEANTLGSVRSTFTIERNTITGFAGQGVVLSARSGSSTNTITVRGNTVLGDANAGTGDRGLWLFTDNSLGGGSPSVINSLIAYNDFSQCNENIYLENTGLASGATRNEASFSGNLIRSATLYGVRFSSAIDDGFMVPDFGGKVGGRADAGRNTFDNSSASFEVGMDPEGDNTIPVDMAENFWEEGLNPQSRTELIGGNFPSFTPILSNSLDGSLSQAVIAPNEAEVITISLDSGRFVVQVDDSLAPDLAAAAGEFGQYQSFQLSGPNGTTDLGPSSVLTVASDGTQLQFSLAALDEGNYTLRFTNPGFQVLSPIGLRVSASSGGGGNNGGGGSGGGGGCVVATAAHGDYNAPEVRILRSFRDEYLLPRSGGVQAVRAYYEHGEPVALWIAERPWAQDATRAALAVPTGIAWSLLNWNTGQRLCAAVFLLGLSFGLLRRRV